MKFKKQIKVDKKPSLRRRILREMMYHPTKKNKLREEIYKECRHMFPNDYEFYKKFESLYKKYKKLEEKKE